MDAQAESRLGPVPIAIWCQKLVELDDVWANRVPLAQTAEPGLLERSTLALDVNVRLEDSNVSAGRAAASDGSANLSTPFPGWACKNRDDRVLDAAPKAGAGAHDRSNLSEIGRCGEEANSGRPKNDLRRQLGHAKFCQARTAGGKPDSTTPTGLGGIAGH
jgi:general stress protein YciG